MKTLAITITALFIIATSVFAYTEEVVKEEKKAPEPIPSCPVSYFTDNAKFMDCHQMITENGKPKFGLKELGIMLMPDTDLIGIRMSIFLFLQSSATATINCSG